MGIFQLYTLCSILKSLHINSSHAHAIASPFLSKADEIHTRRTVINGKEVSYKAAISRDNLEAMQSILGRPEGTYEGNLTLTTGSHSNDPVITLETQDGTYYLYYDQDLLTTTAIGLNTFMDNDTLLSSLFSTTSRELVKASFSDLQSTIFLDQNLAPIEEPHLTGVERQILSRIMATTDLTQQRVRRRLSRL